MQRPQEVAKEVKVEAGRQQQSHRSAEHARLASRAANAASSVEALANAAGMGGGARAEAASAVEVAHMVGGAEAMEAGRGSKPMEASSMVSATGDKRTE